MKERLNREMIALRAVKEFKDGDCVNLGFGMPGLCTLFVPEGKDLIFHAEHGVVGYGRVLGEEDRDQWDFDLINASGQFVAPLGGMCFTDQGTTLAMARIGRVDVTVFGALQVSEKGDLANWTTSTEVSQFVIGGAMDMPIGGKKVIVTMEHTTKKGNPKVVKKCTYPLTAKKCVSLIITDLAVIEVTKDGLLLKEVAPGWTVEEIQSLTEPQLIIAKDIKEIEL